ncbi:AMP-binding protein [Kitasatospora viridis]|uniref:Acyl-CoA synthetase (AMP-forming)/AMP-acid ligase II n=1 Tax=Kitasatospora viridis TaxID=281105 RepID=A0A561UGW3_9ACTN|nr:AMP-binding protein [Kitasatospora viridis]TWF98585.1 acyl-CoA synthetase (AMP-forming)/AMP-acid ligase II [Kitasatospora viridis]
MTVTAPDVFARLARLAEEPDATALISCRPGSSRTITRGQLLQGCRITAAALRTAGARPGHKAVVMTRDAYDLTTITYALWSIGAVPTLIEPRAEVGRCLREIAPDLFIGEPLAHLGRRVLGWGRGHVRLPLVTGPSFPGQRLALGRRLAVHTPDADGPPWQQEEPTDDDLAMIAFTSGSTGRPKGAEYRYATLAGQLEALATLLAPRPGDVLLAGFLPLVLFGPLLGLTTVTPAVNHLAPARTPPQGLIDPILRHQVTTIAASPAVLTLIAGHCARHDVRLPSARQALSFGAPLRPRLADALRRALPHDTKLRSVYGATECLPVSAITDHDLRTAAIQPPPGHTGTCLGHPLPGMQPQILDADATGLGEIAVSGPTVSPAYHGRPDADATAKITTSRGVLHRTGDMGRLDDQGQLWFLGRKAHLVTGSGFTLTTEDIETLADTTPGVRRTALVGLGPAGSQEPVLCVESLPSAPRATALDAVRTALRSHPEGHRIGALLLHPGFPTDPRHNSKIDRPRLAAWAAKRLRRRTR